MENIEADSIEILNLDKYERAYGSDQPSILLHGMAHAIYHSLSANERYEIDATYESAMRSKVYDSVLNYYWETGPAYAKKDPPTYFAECTEAFLRPVFELS